MATTRKGDLGSRCTPQNIVMICTRSRGGMRSVVEAYRSAGLFARRNILLIETHDEGSLLHRLAIAASALAQFFQMLLRRDVALLHAHISMRGSFWRKSLFIMLARLFNVPVIAHLHGSSFEAFVTEEPAWRQRIIIAQLERMDRLLVLGEHWRKYIFSIAPRARVQVLPNSVRMPNHEVSDLSGPAVEMLFLGIVGRRKGVYDLLEAMALVKIENPAVHLTIGGNGEVSEAQNYAVKLGVSDVVKFVGWVDGAVKQALIQSSEIYVLPSHNEGLPVSILEAMSYQLPIISTNVGSIAELVRDGIDGLIVAPGDVVALAEAILKLTISLTLRREMGANARQRVGDQFSEEAVLPRLECLYDELLDVAALNVSKH